MFLGHYAVALAAKKAAPKTSLGTLVLAAQFLDLLWPILLLVGVEHVRIAPGITPVAPLDFYDYPFSHSLLFALIWACLVGGCYAAVRGYGPGALALGACVFSHWLLDALAHRPDLPLAPGLDSRIGLGLWYSFAGTVVVEVLLFLAGVLIYATTTAPEDRIGRFGFWLLVGFLVVIYGANLLGPPPPDAASIAVAGNAGWLIVLWAAWVDRHRLVPSLARARRPDTSPAP